MPAFAVYYVPPEDSELYEAGSQIIGYDVYAGKLLPIENEARSHFQYFDPEWGVVPQEFGLHITIGHALDYEEGRLPEIEAELESILNLFDSSKPFTLVPDNNYLPMWGGTHATAYYQANQAFMMFHAMVIARIHPFGVTTPMHTAIQNGEFPYDLPLAQQHQVEQYLHSYILEDWHPHFGLLRPFAEEHRDKIRRGF